MPVSKLTRPKMSVCVGRTAQEQEQARASPYPNNNAADSDAGVLGINYFLEASKRLPGGGGGRELRVLGDSGFGDSGFGLPTHSDCLPPGIIPPLKSQQQQVFFLLL